MFTALKLIVFVLSLGIDTLVISTSLGVLEVRGKMKIGLTFAMAETLMTLMGFFVGHSAGQWIGVWASLLGGLALVGLAVWLLFFEDTDDENEKLKRGLVGWAFVVTALGISLDELAVGFSMGLVGVPIVLTVILIAAQALLFAFLGLTYGRRLKPLLGEWSEQLAGSVLGLLGLWITGAALTSLFFTHHTY